MTVVKKGKKKISLDTWLSCHPETLSCRSLAGVSGPDTERARALVSYLFRADLLPPTSAYLHRYLPLQPFPVIAPRYSKRNSWVSTRRLILRPCLAAAPHPQFWGHSGRSLAKYTAPSIIRWAVSGESLPPSSDAQRRTPAKMRRRPNDPYSGRAKTLCSRTNGQSEEYTHVFNYLQHVAHPVPDKLSHKKELLIQHPPSLSLGLFLTLLLPECDNENRSASCSLCTAVWQIT